MDSIPWEKAKLSEFGKNRTACFKKSHPDILTMQTGILDFRL
jgi:hypothetical protein